MRGSRKVATPGKECGGDTLKQDYWSKLREIVPVVVEDIMEHVEKGARGMKGRTLWGCNSENCGTGGGSEDLTTFDIGPDTKDSEID